MTVCHKEGNSFVQFNQRFWRLPAAFVRHFYFDHMDLVFAVQWLQIIAMDHITQFVSLIGVLI